jgi:hypothetical protein
VSNCKRALAVAELYPIFPVKVAADPDHPGKTKKIPLVKWTEKATQNPATIKRWFEKWPRAHVGVPTGQRSGIFAVDVDPEGKAWPELKTFPRTQINYTRRGRHYLFQHAEGIGSNQGTVADGIDIRGDGGYIVWWPAEGNKVLRDGVVAKAPGSLLKQLRRPKNTETGERGDIDVLTNHKLREVKKLLRRVDPDKHYDKWYQLGAAIKLQFGDAGFDVWDQWSSVGAKYPGAEALRAKWQSFKRTKGNVITLRSLEQWANPKRKLKKPVANAPIQFRHAADLVKERRMPEWLLRKVLEKEVLAVLAGPRGTYKSFIALEWTMRAVVAGHGAVILSGEGAGLGRRIHAWRKEHGKGLKLRELPLLALERILDLNNPKIVEQLAKAIAQVDFDVELVVIDTLSKYSAGMEENSNSEVAEFLSELAVKIREHLRATVLLVAHTGHDNQGRARGASSLTANTDAEYIVSKPTESTVVVTRQRFKDTPALEDLAYLASPVDLGYVDDELESVTSLVLTEMPPPPRERKAEKVGPVETVVLQVVQECADDEGWASEKEVVAKAIDKLPEEGGPRDRRRDRVRKSLTSLIAKQHLTMQAGKIRGKE